jgi:hypothetical protein
MAETVKDAVANVAEKVSQLTTGESAPNLVLDEVTGEKVSKSEFKKRQKQREKDVKKAEKEATRQPPPQAKRKAGSAEEDEAKLNPNVSQDDLCAQSARRNGTYTTRDRGEAVELHTNTSWLSNTSRSARAPSSA